MFDLTIAQFLTYVVAVVWGGAFVACVLITIWRGITLRRDDPAWRSDVDHSRQVFQATRQEPANLRLLRRQQQIRAGYQQGQDYGRRG